MWHVAGVASDVPLPVPATAVRRTTFFEVPSTKSCTMSTLSAMEL